MRCLLRRVQQRLSYTNIAQLLNCATKLTLSTAATIDAQLLFAPRADAGVCSTQHFHARDGRLQAIKISKCYCQVSATVRFPLQPQPIRQASPSMKYAQRQRARWHAANTIEMGCREGHGCTEQVPT